MDDIQDWVTYAGFMEDGGNYCDLSNQITIEQLLNAAIEKGGRSETNS